MKLANIAGRASIIIDGKVLDIENGSNGELSSDLSTIVDLDNADRLKKLAEADVSKLPDLDPSTIGAPVLRPSKVVALALNYASHVIESNKTFPEEPHVMVKLPSSIIGPYDDIVKPKGRDMIDFETEIVLVVGRKFTAISEDEAWDVVAGITAGQDISDRGEQFRAPIKQFSMAKSYDTFSPIGPFLVTPDEFPNRDDIGMTGWVDGEEMQTARTSDFIFSVPATLAWLSRFVTFEVGDLIFTGTTGGVGDARTPPVYLHPGAVVETEVEHVGRMRNVVVER
jgi:2-keto-4-pentenoate hydratase/2-oxohepta-3-ene-1,7-dioic acid hydratase in catechol pathway